MTENKEENEAIQREAIQKEIVKLINHLVVLNKFPVWLKKGGVQSLENFADDIVERAGIKIPNKGKFGKIDKRKILVNYIDNEMRESYIDGITWCPNEECDSRDKPVADDQLLEIHVGPKNYMYIPLKMFEVYEDYLRKNRLLDDEYKKKLDKGLKDAEKKRTKIFY